MSDTNPKISITNEQIDRVITFDEDAIIFKGTRLFIYQSGNIELLHPVAVPPETIPPSKSNGAGNPFRLKSNTKDLGKATWVSWKLLEQASHEDGPCTLFRLRKRAGVVDRHATNRIRTLVNQGLLVETERQGSGSTKIHYYRITPLGRAFLDDTAEPAFPEA